MNIEEEIKSQVKEEEIKLSIPTYDGVFHLTKHKINNERIVKNYVPNKYCVDDSMFQPTSEVLKRLSGTRALTAEEIKLYYDFSNGKDTGEKVPLERSKSNLEIEILSKDLQNKKEALKENAAETTEDIKRAVERAERISQMTNQKTSKTTE